MKKKPIPKLIAGNYYHIFNRANNREIIFPKEKNYTYFLGRFRKHLHQYISLYAYCLLPDHFHMLLRVNHEKIKIAGEKNERTINQAFSNFFNSYSKSINEQQKRFGNFFNRPFKRKQVTCMKDLIGLICYIHRNPLHHDNANDYETYKWSSFYGILTENNALIDTKTVLRWFDGTENFLKIHEITGTNFIEVLEK